MQLLKDTENFLTELQTDKKAASSKETEDRERAASDGKFSLKFDFIDDWVRVKFIELWNFSDGRGVKNFEIIYYWIISLYHSEVWKNPMI